MPYLNHILKKETVIHLHIEKRQILPQKDKIDR